MEKVSDAVGGGLRKRLLSIAEASAYLGLCSRTLRRLADRGALPVVRINGCRRLLFDVAALDSWIAAQGAEGAR